MGISEVCFVPPIGTGIEHIEGEEYLGMSAEITIAVITVLVI